YYTAARAMMVDVFQGLWDTMHAVSCHAMRVGERIPVARGNTQNAGGVRREGGVCDEYIPWRALAAARRRMSLAVQPCGCRWRGSGDGPAHARESAASACLCLPWYHACFWPPITASLGI